METTTEPKLKQILIVDDDRDQAFVISSLLQRSGLACFTANSLKEATQLSSQQVPSLLIVDWKMPHLDGMSLIEQLRRHYQGELPAILLSASYEQLNLNHLPSNTVFQAKQHLLTELVPLVRSILCLDLESFSRQQAES